MTPALSTYTILITGGAGFIGSAVIRHLIAETEARIVNVDKLTYAGNLESLASVADNERYHFEQVDICDLAALEAVFDKYQPTAVMHLAAESHVDRSIAAAAAFVQTNLVGTYTLLEVARSYVDGLARDQADAFRFHHISTDEVFGDLEPGAAAFTESTPYAPSSPYSATKAGSDHLVRAWHRTYGLPVVVSNCSNNYGPFQFPEKLVPLMILNAIDRQPLPVYGDGQQVRDWLYVEDHARALVAVLTKGTVGETYNIGGHNEVRNIDVVERICEIVDELRDRRVGLRPPRDDKESVIARSAATKQSDEGVASEAKQSHESEFNSKQLIEFVTDRPGHDRRYAIDAGKIERELGWTPQETFDTGLRKTVEWYVDNPKWVDHVRSGEYRQWLERNYAKR